MSNTTYIANDTSSTNRKTLVTEGSLSSIKVMVISKRIKVNRVINLPQSYEYIGHLNSKEQVKRHAITFCISDVEFHTHRLVVDIYLWPVFFFDISPF